MAASKWRRRSTGSAIVALAAATAAGMVFLAQPAAAQQSEGCPPVGAGPGISNEPLYTDNNVAIYAGQDFTASDNAAEAEGVTVVIGDAVFDRTSGSFNVGTVGAGSQIAPAPGSTMLAVGGNLTVGPGTTLIVGANSVDEEGNLLGGDVDLGGTAQVAGTIDLNNGTLTENDPTATAPYADFGAHLAEESAAFIAMPDTGTVTPSGASLTFAGDGTSNPQVFTVSATDLAAARDFFFTDIPMTSGGGYAPTVINVTGAGPVSLQQQFVSINGTRVDDGSVASGNGARALLWNFADANDVTIAGSSQTVGSLLVPNAGGTLTITASTNGRVYTNGDILMNGTGNQLHNYPWDGGRGFGCVPPSPPGTGGFTIVKEVEGDSGGSVTEFTGDWSCTAAGSEGESGSWSLSNGESVEFTGFPIGTTCTITEDIPTDPAGTWSTVVEPATVTITGDPAATVVTATNTFSRTPPTPTPTPTATPIPTATPTLTPTPTRPPLPVTGPGLPGFLAVASVVLALGVLLVVASLHRRRDDTASRQ